jgi:hypothetical protein
MKAREIIMECQERKGCRPQLLLQYIPGSAVQCNAMHSMPEQAVTDSPALDELDLATGHQSVLNMGGHSVNEAAQVLALHQPHGQALQEDQICQGIMHALGISTLECPANLRAHQQQQQQH